MMEAGERVGARLPAFHIFFVHARVMLHGPIYHFDIRVDPARDFVHYTLGGFFDRKGVMALMAARGPKMAGLTCAPHSHVTLADIQKLNLQSQAVLPAFQALIAGGEFRSRRLAIVSGVSLARMQVRRLSDRPDVQVFGTVADAEAWLFAPDPVPAVAS